MSGGIDFSEDEFIRRISGLREDAVLQGGYLTEEQIEEVFPALTQEQKKLLLDYFKENHIGIGAALPEEELLGSEESAHLKLYLEELSELEPLDEATKRALIMSALNGDRVARERVMNSYLHSVVEIARLYTGQGVEVVDLIGEGNVALAVAMSMLESIEEPEDCDQMVIRSVMNAMEEAIGRESDEVELIQKMLLKVMRVGDKAQALSQELRRKVSIAELLEEDEEGLTEEEIREALRLSKGLTEYIAL